MTREARVLQHLMQEGNGDTSLAGLLDGIQPPELCRIHLALLAANYNEIKGVKAHLEQRDCATILRRQRFTDGVAQALIIAVLLAAARALNWL